MLVHDVFCLGNRTCVVCMLGWSGLWQYSNNELIPLEFHLQKVMLAQSSRAQTCAVGVGLIVVGAGRALGEGGGGWGVGFEIMSVIGCRSTRRFVY